MKQLTDYMIETYKINVLGYDFMGYIFDKRKDLTFHHLAVPRKCSKDLDYDKGYTLWNGVILCGSTAHSYLHLIESVEPEIFFEITRVLIDENVNGRLDLESLKEIRKFLEFFEEEHKEDVNKKGDVIIKPDFVEKRISLK